MRSFKQLIVVVEKILFFYSIGRAWELEIDPAPVAKETTPT